MIAHPALPADTPIPSGTDPLHAYLAYLKLPYSHALLRSPR